MELNKDIVAKNLMFIDRNTSFTEHLGAFIAFFMENQAMKAETCIFFYTVPPGNRAMKLQLANSKTNTIVTSA